MMKRFIILFILFGNINFAQEIVSDTNDTTNIINENTNTNFLGQFYDGADAQINNTQETESVGLIFLRILLITGILAFLVWIVLKFFFRKNALSLTHAGKSIEILATVPAGLGAYFVITKLGNLYYLMSLSNDGLRLLDKITDQEAIDFIELNKEDTIPQDIKFVDLLTKLPEGKPKQALEFLREKIDQLKHK